MSIPFALSLTKYLHSAGTDIGFGSLIAVALLVVLYFAGARESRILREELEDADDRLAELETRVGETIAAASARGPVSAGPGPRPGVVPAPRVAAQMIGSTVARVSAEATASAAAPPRGVLLGSPAGSGAPALGSATKLIASPALRPRPVESDPVAPARPVSVQDAVGAIPVVPSPMGSAGRRQATAGADAAMPPAAAPSAPEFVGADAVPARDDTLFVPASTAAASNGRSGRRTGSPAPARVDFHDELPPVAGDRRLLPPFDEIPLRRGPSRVALTVGGAAAAVVLVVLLLALTGSPRTARSASASTPAAAPAHHHAASTAQISPATITVSVLNGTAVNGLAAAVGQKLSAAGYTVPATAITNAAIQTAATTTVAYLPGARAAAAQVAAALTRASGVTVTTLTPASQATITSCATPAAGGQPGTCPAKVIITVGSDLAAVANTTTTG
ncbi:LytR C-terminal domain-containing protein [Conexibacter sp. DBS9H8]|uniref:LytR C-terminal domain-containing protein n=1 Tax=Conexibacter sp. DBS9H8 TaxID=2937801 RepID=UPI00200F85AB|nr:LytR C-terminal domain-containing protein [Conexibacter sp. DBS9H8]